MIVFLALFVSNVVTIFIGMNRGKKSERERCLGICYNVWQRGSHSPTAGRITRSIEDGRYDLISEDEFYG